MMMKVILVSLLVFVSEALQDVGSPGWTCDLEVMKKSKTIPTSAHSVRFADIEYIAALGDSLTAANGAGASPNDPVAILLQYRGLTFSLGGDKSLDEHVTLASEFIVKFNPDVFGWSIGTGSADAWNKARLNAGIPGARSGDLSDQANDVIRRIKEHPEIDYMNKWKLVHIFIGGNDMCAYCNSPDTENADKFGDNIKAAVQIMKDNLPKTIVVLTGMFDMSMLRKIDKTDVFCQGLHLFECKCESDTDFTDQEIHDASKLYMAAEQKLQDSGMFDTTDDFTLVIQPFFNDLTQPPSKPDGTVNLDFFAADCFHFSQLGHAMTAKNLWNNLVQAVGKKNTLADVNDLDVALQCPDKSCPFIRTTKNSKDCSKYMTPAA